MWDAEVLEPRLVASWPTGAALPPEVLELTAPLGERYGVDFDSCLVNLYRDGSDAVAWHADTVRTDDARPAGGDGVARRPTLVPAAAGRAADRCSGATPRARATSSSWAAPASTTGTTPCRASAAPRARG